MTKSILRRVFVFLVALLIVNCVSYLIAAIIQHRWPMNFNAEVPPLPLGELLRQYGVYLMGVLGGDLGVTNRGREVLEVVMEGIPRSLILLILALTVAATLGPALGLLSVDAKRKEISPLALLVSLAGFSMPGFYIAIVMTFSMIQLFSGTGGGSPLPASGYGLDAHLVLPVIALAVRPTAEIARLTAELLAEELPKDYVRAAWAKGLPWRRVVFRHAFRNVAATVVVSLGNSLRYLVSGLVLIEWFFDWHGGIGRTLAGIFIPASFDANYEPALTAALLTAIGVLFLVATLGIETITYLLDPRVRRQYAEL